jgi:hypothetical protein
MAIRVLDSSSLCRGAQLAQRVRMRTSLLCTFLVGLVAAAGCGTSTEDDGAQLAVAPDAPSCPAVKPDQDSACTAPAGTQCTYLIEACACGPSDIEWSCTCGTNGGWDCSRGYDCYPCP